MLAWGWGKRLSKLFTLLSAGIKFLRYRRMTVGQYMDKLTQDEDLKLALITNLGYYHDDPYSCSLILFLFGQSSYITGGGWFIKGGSQILSDKLAEVITENGGSILTKHKVTKILTEGITAVGVEFMRQKRPDTLLQQARGKYIVANAPLPLVVDELLSDHDIDTSKLDALEPGCSLITIYYSLSEAVAPETDGIYSSFVYDDSVTSLKEFGPTERSGDYSRKGYVVVNYSVIDHGLGSPTMVICGVDYLKNWEGMSKDEYKQRKEEVMDIYQERLEKQFPGIGSKITYREMSTPRTIQRYTLNPHGTVYGYAPTPKQFLRNRTKLIKPKINNLFYASAWVGVGGFSSALQFGSRTAKRILRKEEK
jgi:phytoene dehydrogenase-like protein